MAAGVDKETLDMMLDSIKSYCADKFPLERLIELDAQNICPVDELRKMCDPNTLGVQLLLLPEEYGGMGGSTFDMYRLCELMSYIDLGIGTALFATFLGSDPLVWGGTPEQKERWLTPISSGSFYAYGATEPEAGSDLGALRTKAVRVEQDGKIVGYKISGQKQWISNGGFADLYTVLANAPGGPTWFVLDRNTPGFEPGKHEDKHGIRLSDTSPLLLDEAYVAADQAVGGVEGQGLVQAQLVFGYTRLMVAAFGLGGGWKALDRAMEYSTQRIAAGGPLSTKQGYTHKLIVTPAVRLEAGRSFLEESAEAIDSDTSGKLYNTEGAIAKYMSTEAGNFAAECGIQAHGGYGYVKEYEVEKVKRDVRITCIYEGTSEIMEMTIARDRWQEHLKTRGGYYHDKAAELEKLAATHPDSGAATAALANHALAEILERARAAKLTRSQHILFRVGELMAWAECAGAAARRAARAADGTLSEKADDRFDAKGKAAVSRVFAREAALKVAEDGVKWVIGSGGLSNGDVGSLLSAINEPAIYAAQDGMLSDMDAVSQALYEKVVPRD